MLKLESKIALAKFTSIKIGGIASQFYEPTNLDDFTQCLNNLKDRSIPFFVLGGGSNLLISSQGFEGLVIRTTKLTNITQIDDTRILADAGVRLPHLAKFAASLNLSGLEFSCGIPGTVGGGVIMNAGAHGSSMSNLVEYINIFDLKSHSVKKLTKNELAFEYRKCILDSQNEVVLNACLKLEPGIKEAILAKIKINEDYRWRTQPLSYPNAGSTFKNHSIDKQAGKLLDLAGVKNLTCGGASVSAIHANFVINIGQASSSDVLELLKKMQDSVWQKFNIKLHPEWKTLGTFENTIQDIWD